MYNSPSNDKHMIDEEQQWGRIAEIGSAAHTLALVYIQKLCTAFHEFEPAFKAGTLQEKDLEFFRGRLLSRLDYALEVMDKNSLGKADGIAGLRDLREEMANAGSMEALAAMSEKIHMANHKVCEGLEHANS